MTLKFWKNTHTQIHTSPHYEQLPLHLCVSDRFSSSSAVQSQRAIKPVSHRWAVFSPSSYWRRFYKTWRRGQTGHQWGSHTEGLLVWLFLSFLYATLKMLRDFVARVHLKPRHWAQHRRLNSLKKLVSIWVTAARYVDFLLSFFLFFRNYK